MTRTGEYETPHSLPARHGGPGSRVLACAILTAGALSLAFAIIGCGAPVSLVQLSLPDVVKAIKLWRWVLLLGGWILLPTGALLLMIERTASDHEKRALVRTALIFLGVVAGLAIANHALMAIGRYYGTAHYFPISVTRGPELHVGGIPFAVGLLIILWLALRGSSRLNAVHVWGIALGLIVLGNLAQGGVRLAFHVPLAGSGVQYYHEAIRVGDWREWLRGFGAVQDSLGTHARTHPPFAVLIHYFLLRAVGGSVLLLAGAVTLLSSLTVPLVRSIVRELGASGERATEFALLFAVIPAFNIYSAVSLDGVVAMLAGCFLLGLVMVLRRGLSTWALILFSAGLILLNALTFAGLLVVAVAGLVAIAEVAAGRRYGVAAALALALAVGFVLHQLSLVHLGYDHVQAFVGAVGLELAHGGTLLRTPGVYVWTRAEDVIEIALFMSIGILVVLFRRRLLGVSLLDVRDRMGRVFLAVVAVLAASFVVGTYRTGETARACLFCYPFLVLVLRRLDGSVVRALAVSAGVQTVAMQLFGAYFW